MTIGRQRIRGEMGAKDAHGVGISQVMPYPWNDTVPVVREYHKALQAFAKHTRYSYYGLEGFLNAKLMAEALRKLGRDATREKLVNVLETTPFDLGGYKINYTPASHNGSRFVDLTVLGRDGRVLR